jgi:outer membrane protein TolC
MSSYSTMWDEREHRLMVGVGVDLPVRRKRLQAEITAARARLSEARLARARLEDEVRAEVHSARERLEEAHHVVELYRSRILPASRDQVEAARAGYETGREGFRELVEAERDLRHVELGYEEELADLHRRATHLDRVLGRMPAVAEATP